MKWHADRRLSTVRQYDYYISVRLLITYLVKDRRKTVLFYSRSSFYKYSSSTNIGGRDEIPDLPDLVRHCFGLYYRFGKSQMWAMKLLPPRTVGYIGLSAVSIAK